MTMIGAHSHSYAQSSVGRFLSYARSASYSGHITNSQGPVRQWILGRGAVVGRHRAAL